MEDKRRHKRFSVDALGINGRMIFANDVKIQDISLGGVSLKADKRFEIGSEYSLKIEYGDKELSLDGVVMWSILRELSKGAGGSVPIYEAGLRFKNLPTDTSAELEKFIRDHGTEEARRPSDNRLSPRVAIDPPQKAFMKFSKSYRVKKLSLSGMLVESDCELMIEERFPMALSLPGNKQMVFTGRVAFCLRKREGDESYDVGMEFVEMPEEDRGKLLKFIRLLEAESSGPRDIFVRREDRSSRRL